MVHTTDSVVNMLEKRRISSSVLLSTIYFVDLAVIGSVRP